MFQAEFRNNDQPEARVAAFSVGLRGAVGAALLVAITVLATHAVAQEQTPDQGKDFVVVSGGVDIDVATFGYGGATFAVPGFSIGHGPAVRVSGFGGAYSYTSSGTVRGKVDATFGGGEADALYQFSNANFWLNLGAGARYVDTTFSPNQPTNRRSGAQWEPALVVDGGATNGPWRGDWFGSYGTALSDYEARASFTHSVTRIVRLGVEGETDGDPTYEEERIGPYAGFSLARNAEIQASAGVSAGSARSTGAYGRLGFYAGF